MNSDGFLQIALPETRQSILLWSETICLWMLINYLWSSGSLTSRSNATKSQKQLIKYSKTILYSTTLFCLPGLNLKLIPARILLILITLGPMLLLPLIRNVLVNKDLKHFAAEWEFVQHITVILVTGWLIAKTSLEVFPGDALIVLPISSKNLITAFIITAAGLFLSDSATHIIRGILFKTGAAPTRKGNEAIEVRDSEVLLLCDRATRQMKEVFLKPQIAVPNETDEDGRENSSTVDIKEFNRGKYIGNLERLLVLSVVIVGSYETIGFIIAGKGLIRAKDFEDRDFAEYFLIGTLSSVAIAIGVGFLVKFAIGYANGLGSGFAK